MQTNEEIKEEWGKDNSPYRTALANAMVVAMNGLINKKDEIEDKLIEARNAVDNEVRNLLSLQKQQMIEKGEKLKKEANNILIPEEGFLQEANRTGYNTGITDYQNLIKE